MKTARALLLILVVTRAVAFATDAGRPIRVDFINPLVDPSGSDAVWSLFDIGYIKISQAAAKQLGMVFTPHPAFRPETMEAETRRLISGPDRPDYLVVTIHRGIGVRLLEIAEQAKVPVFVINAGLLDEDRRRVGGPREHYKYWIGQMLPDDEAAGYELAKILIDRARLDQRFNRNGQVSLAAFSGRVVDGAAVQRNLGLQRAVAGNPLVKLVQVVPAAWDRAAARAKIPLLLERYPDVTAIWAANDGMAMGAIAGLETAGRKPGKDILVGGINWDSDAMHAVADGRLVATMGGHFLESVWTLVLLCDHHHGIDFATERVDWRSGMQALNRENLRNYQPRLETIDWEKINFRRLSKYFSPDLKAYRFSLDELIAPPEASDAPVSNSVER
jgi:ABC-type sugar transport system substrate-binding protein